MAECTVSVDTSAAQKDLQQLRENADFTAVTVATSVKKGYQSIRLLADVFGYTIPIFFDLLISSAIMAGEMFAELAAAETASVWLAIKAGVTFSIALMMFYRAMTLRQEKAVQESKLNSILQLGNLWF